MPESSPILSAPSGLPLAQEVIDFLRTHGAEVVSCKGELLAGDRDTWYEYDENTGQYTQGSMKTGPDHAWVEIRYWVDLPKGETRPSSDQAP